MRSTEYKVVVAPGVHTRAGSPQIILALHDPPIGRVANRHNP
jgi:hypothetical protein